MNLRKTGAGAALIFLAIGILVILGLSKKKDDLHTYRAIALGTSIDDIEIQIGKPTNMSQKELMQFALSHGGTINGPLPDGEFFDGDRTSSAATIRDWYLQSGFIKIAFDSEGHAIWKRYFRFPERTLFEQVKEILSTN